MSVWGLHNLSLERKSQTCAFVFEHRSKLTRCYKQLDFIVAVSHFLEYPFPGNVGSDFLLSYLRTLILKPRAFTRNRLINDWLKPKLRNFTAKNRRGYLHRSGVRRHTMHFVYLCVDFNNGSITT